jgi:hypothetical protein
MKIDQVKTFEDMEGCLRAFTNVSGDPVPYDFNGAFHLFTAVLDNRARHQSDADIASLEEFRPWFTEEPLRFLKHLERLT